MRRAAPGFAVLLALLGSGCAEAPSRHAVLIVIDTLRADALERAETPVLDALASRGTSAELASAPSTWTVPSVISLFTGAHVREHGWDVKRARHQERLPPLPARPTLAEVLAGAGFATSGLYANPILSWEIGFRRGFQRWQRTTDRELPGLVAAEVAGGDDAPRRFLYLHLLGPHEPLAPSAEARRRWQLEDVNAGRAFSQAWVRAGGTEREARLDAYRRAYHAVVEDTDRRLGEVLEGLAPLLDDALLIVTSHHGEILGQVKRLGHGPFLYEPLTRVPFVAVGAGALPSRLTLAAVPDLITTALGVDADWSARVSAAEPLVSQRSGRLAYSPDGRFKIFRHPDGRQRAFDLERDPAEERHLEPVPRDLSEALDGFEARVRAGHIEGTVPVRVDAETVEALRALGYLDAPPP